MWSNKGSIEWSTEIASRKTEQNDVLKREKRAKKENHRTFSRSVMVGEGGFEPPKSLTTDLQSAPFGHSGTLPYTIFHFSQIEAQRSGFDLERKKELTDM